MLVRMRMLLAITSFVVYVAALLALRQDRDNVFLAERDAFAAAVSAAVYHAPLGTTYSGVSRWFWDFDTPLEPVLKKATKGDFALGSLLQDGGSTGNGIGYVVLATWAMLFFGVHTYSPIVMLLGLMVISATAFLLRFGDDHAVIVALYFFALSLLLFSVLVWHPATALNIPIGGIRYFAVLGILPSFHIGCELLDFAAPRSAIGQWKFCLLAIQVVILILAVLTRTSNFALAGAICLIWLFGIRRTRRDHSCLWRQIGTGAFIVGVAGGFCALIMLLLPPSYLGEGRVSGIVWHRAFVSLGLNPEWPFGNLQEIYDCNYEYSPGWKLEPGPLDKNGRCVWLHYAHAHNLPIDTTNIALYETVMRHAFVNVARLYPWQVAKTFIYYKPRLIFASITQAVDPRFFELNSYSSLLKGLLFASFGNLLAFFVTPSMDPSPIRSLRLGGLTLLFALFISSGSFIAWGGPAQTVDLRVYVILTVGIALYALVECVYRALSADGAGHRGLGRVCPGQEIERRATNNSGRSKG